ncbi:MAG: hypothetical protein AVDCRST_MAG24-550 [uncultured Nocardioidaceae bacterium]|uniref:Uncharacterized protein n=1 Tax=uncultured Nocardioidaceae bacterium TaxID=253824 RepID=A0A6J4LCW1_9ACTN|nr:MAG: hypothetical protein AVDCRST_MAG24-550 [uncultured Nocardioidaceae bacterium]
MRASLIDAQAACSVLLKPHSSSWERTVRVGVGRRAGSPSTENSPSRTRPVLAERVVTSMPMPSCAEPSSFVLVATAPYSTGWFCRSAAMALGLEPIPVTDWTALVVGPTNVSPLARSTSSATAADEESCTGSSMSLGRPLTGSTPSERIRSWLSPADRRSGTGTDSLPLAARSSFSVGVAPLMSSWNAALRGPSVRRKPWSVEWLSSEALAAMAARRATRFVSIWSLAPVIWSGRRSMMGNVAASRSAVAKPSATEAMLSTRRSRRALGMPSIT